MSWAAATQAPGVSSTKPAYKTNPYEVPTYGKTGGGGGPAPMQESTINASPGYVPGAPAPATPAMAPPLPMPATGAPKSEAGAEAQAMQGLSMAMEQHGPTPGWADDPSLVDTSDQLGNRVGSDAMGVLSELINKRGRLY